MTRSATAPAPARGVPRSARLAVGLAAVALLAVPAGARGASPPLVELRVDGKPHRGRIVAENEARCWLQGRDGRLDQFGMKQIESQKPVGQAFRAASVVELRDQLKREFGPGCQTTATDHYVVCAPKGAVEKYGPLFEDVYRSTWRHFSVRGFEMKKPEFPLVAVVYSDRNRFVEQCRADRVSFTVGVVGYYHPTTNRVAVFDPTDTATSEAETRESPETWLASSGRRPALPWSGEAAAFGGTSPAVAAARASVRDTIVHESIHQVAYNTGLHTRLGDTPRWVIEGLATWFEAPGVREGGAKAAPIAQRINRERWLRFGAYAKSRRPARSLRSFLETDEMMHDATLDFYAQAWSLTFFLIETRPAAYARYLKRISERDPLTVYPAKQRVIDFEAAFDTDAERIEIDFLRMMERLKVD